jgi:cbb3-type cytochrome oxidase subunit 3
MKNTVNWGASNFGLIVFFLCFSMVFFLIIRFTKRSKKSNGNF